MEWVDPRQVLVNLRWLEHSLPSEMDERVRHLRTNQLKSWREARMAALFAFGIGDQVLKTPTLVSKTEERDFDFVMKWKDTDADHFYPVQLKELPPNDINSEVSLDHLHDKLEKYSGLDDLSVVICINRRMHFEYRPWKRPTRPKIRELWYLGCQAPDQSKWFLYGSALEENPKEYKFNYPEGVPNVA